MTSLVEVKGRMGSEAGEEAKGPEAVDRASAVLPSLKAGIPLSASDAPAALLSNSRRESFFSIFLSLFLGIKSNLNQDVGMALSLTKRHRGFS